jgi:hypothetical protein
MNSVAANLGLSMANSDYFILGALRRIGDQRCTYADIIEASEVKCTLVTVWRSLDRMERRRIIEQVSRTKQGCVYRILKKDQSVEA